MISRIERTSFFFYEEEVSYGTRNDTNDTLCGHQIQPASQPKQEVVLGHTQSSKGPPKRKEPQHSHQITNQQQGHNHVVNRYLPSCGFVWKLTTHGVVGLAHAEREIDNLWGWIPHSIQNHTTETLR